MKPISFKEQNCVFAEDQSEYLPLPTLKDKNGLVTSCYHVTFWEAIKILFGAKVWVTLMTFNEPLQPQRLHVGNSPNINDDYE